MLAGHIGEALTVYLSFLLFKLKESLIKSAGKMLAKP